MYALAFTFVLCYLGFMKLKLYSDYRDYFDHMFDLSGTPFIRFSQDFLSKKNQLALLSAAGFLVPRSNYLYKLIYSYDWIGKYVVYTDPSMHRGEGKILLNREDIIMGKLDDPSLFECYASQFIDTNSTQPKSHRILNIGRRQFKIEYTSDDLWRSNCGNVKIEFCGELEESCKIPSPLDTRALWAIDFVGTFTVDLNTSPGLIGSGIEDILTATEVVDLLKEFYEKRN